MDQIVSAAAAPSPHAQRYLTRKEAAAHTGYAENTLAKLAVSGGGPKFYKPRGKVGYLLEDLDTWMHNGARASTSQAA